MSFKHWLTKFTSLALIFSSLYQTFLSVNAIFFIYPQLNPQGQDVLLIQEGLVEKALILYLSMMASGIYGALLLFKPAKKVKIIHIVFGALIFIASTLFLVKTPFTTDPVLEFVKNSIWNYENFIPWD